MPRDATDTLVGFARTLRAAGVAATSDRVQALVRSLAELDPGQRDDVYWAGRLTLCANHEDIERYDRVFAAYFAGEAPHRRLRPIALQRAEPQRLDLRDDDGSADEPHTGRALVVSASGTEVLRHRDFAALSADERAQIAYLLTLLRMPGETRRSRRLRPAARGSLDRSRSVREMLRRGGEPARLRHRTPARRRRRVVVLLDVSGSMSIYADALLRFVHATSRRVEVPTEVFTVGTRLTRVTREMGNRDPDTAMAALAAAVPDWSGGTRLGALLKEFLDTWGQRGMARGAVVVVLSDGWERGDPQVLGEQMARLSRLAHRVVWANPRKARPGFAPTAAGMAAALPYVDNFVEGHSLAALEQLAGVVAGAASGQRGGRHA